jgi:enoyl-CoA hydratase/carnithine racemase
MSAAGSGDRRQSTANDSDGAPVTLDVTDGIARVVLNRPAQLNAIDVAVLERLDAICERIERDDTVRVVTLTGAGRAFCAGADLTVVQERAGDTARWQELMALWHRVFDRIEKLPRPVVAGVHGLALAGGLELLLVADLVVVDESARIGDQHANFGLVAGGGGSQRLPRLIGARRAKELMLLGGWLSAKQALEWGLVNRVAPAGRLDEVLAEVARDLADKSVEASQTVKKLVGAAPDVELSAGLALERAEVARHMQGADADEGLRAFVAKRPPVFRRRP